MSSNLIRWGVRGALLAAIGWTVSSIVAFVFGVAPFGPVESLSWYLIESSDAIAEAGMLAALVGLHVRQAPNYGRLGTAGFVVAFVGTACLFLTTVIWLFTAYEVGEGVILDVLEIPALLGMLAGFPLLGIATFRARVLPRWCGVLLIAYPAIFALAFYLVDFYGEARVLLGLPWLALGYALWSERGASVEQPRVGAKT
jgi:hypothetical protein